MAEPWVVDDESVAKLCVPRLGPIDSASGQRVQSERPPTNPDLSLVGARAGVRLTADYGLGGRRGTSDGIAKMLALNGRLVS